MFDVIEQNGAVLGFGVAFLALAAMLAAFLFLSYRDYRRQVRQEQQFLTMQFQLLQNHYQSIQTQMSLDGGMPEAGRCADGGDHETGV